MLIFLLKKYFLWFINFLFTKVFIILSIIIILSMFSVALELILNGMGFIKPVLKSGQKIGAFLFLFCEFCLLYITIMFHFLLREKIKKDSQK